jgi:hypothetical protein
MKAKITYNPKENTMTYLFEANDTRYNKLFVFNVAPDDGLVVASSKKVE